MLIISQNLTNYDIEIPVNAIFRINLAWVNDLATLKKILEKHTNHEIFLDLPINRTKPPNNQYSLTDLKPIVENHKNIKYFAISNVDSEKDLISFKDLFPKSVTIVPKIESPTSVNNIEKIVKCLGDEKIVMLDHDDLFSSLLKNNESIENFQNYIKKLKNFCDENNVKLLRTIGVLFSDEENKTSQYVK